MARIVIKLGNCIRHNFVGICCRLFWSDKTDITESKFQDTYPRKAEGHFWHDYSQVGKEGDLVEVGFFVERISGTASNNVQILVKKIWYTDEEIRIKNEWKHFVPSNLKWAANDSRFANGVVRYCHLGIYGDPPSNDFVGGVFHLHTVENHGDPLFDAFSSMLPDSKNYEIELLLSGDNVNAPEYKIQMEITDIRALGPIGEDGYLVGGKLEDAIEIKII